MSSSDALPTTISVNLEADAISALTTQVILDSITPADRENLIRQAIATLLARPSYTKLGNFGGPITEALEQAVQKSAGEVAAQIVAEDDGLHERLRQLATNALSALVSEDSPFLRREIRRAVGRALEDGMDDDDNDD